MEDRERRLDPVGYRPLPLAALRLPFDLPDQQVDGPVDVVGLDVPNDGVEEGPDLLMVSRSQCSLLLHWKHKTFQSRTSLFQGCGCSFELWEKIIIKQENQ